MATLLRSTPSFALPATQNTAPVHEFRCLYTHDVRKKAKKWHDGSARFHTFNRRVMVYDDTKNYIGDLHYRADEEFGEGVELQLDRGVLVEIGERVGETQTDLTGIIHRPQTENVNTPNASGVVRPRPVQRVNHMTSQGRPKPLSELLGTPLGRLGRAQLPQRSPFEERQVLQEMSEVEPPPKRQRLASGKENEYPTNRVAGRPMPIEQPTVQARAVTKPSEPSLQGDRLVSAQIATARISRPAPSTIDISSDEDQEPQRTAARKKSRKTTTPPQQKTQQLEQSSERERTILSPDRSIARNAYRVRSKIAPVLESQSRGLSRPTSASRTSSTVDGPTLQPGMSVLRMRLQKPRQKLMYKALLQTNATTRTASTISGHALERIRAHNNQSSEEECSVHADGARQKGQSFELNGSGNSVIAAEPSPDFSLAQDRGKTPSPIPQTRRPSPLFVSQTESLHPPSPARAFQDDNLGLPATQDMFDDGDVEAVKVIDDRVNESDEEHLSCSPESPCFPQPPQKSTASKQPLPTKMPPPKLPARTIIEPSSPPPSHHTLSPIKSRPFARSLSASDSPLPCDPRASPARLLLQPVEGSPITARQLQTPLHLQPLLNSNETSKLSPARVKSPLRRSRSDTAFIVPTTIAPIMEAPATVEQGPWTGLEAFLLFDSWPTCKQKSKPTFAPLTPPNEDADNAAQELDSDMDYDGIDLAPVAKKTHPVFIRSARSFLRDG